MQVSRSIHRVAVVIADFKALIYSTQLAQNFCVWQWPQCHFAFSFELLTLIMLVAISVIIKLKALLIN